MRRLFYLACAVLVTFSLTGCASQNEASRNTPNNTQMQENANNRMSFSKYKDGTYTGEGDIGPNGIRQIATIVVSKGKITAVNLKNVDTNGYEITDSIVNAAEGKGNNTTGQPSITPSTSGNSNGMNGTNNGVNAPSNTNGGTNNGMAQNEGNINNNANNNPGIRGGVSTPNTAGNSTNPPSGGGAINNPGNNTTNRSAQDIAQSRQSLASAIVQKQTTNVSINTKNTLMVNNWKTAVERALSKAKR